MRIGLLVLLSCVAACETTVPGQQPVGGSTDSEARLQRYIRRAYLDLAARPPEDAELAAATARLREAGNTPTARAAFAGELLDSAEHARVWIEELENTVFGGLVLDRQYDLLCGLVRNEPPCQACASPEPCACTCPQIAALVAERDALRTTAADLRAGATTSAIERRYADKAGYYVLAGSPENRVRRLFDDFLARPAEPEELENGRAMVIGSLLPGSPAGLLFHRHGADYADLLAIVFESEVYREAIVRRVFERYLARAPRPAELAHFLTTLDAADPDARGLVRAVVTSREYFEQ